MKNRTEKLGKVSITVEEKYWNPKTNYKKLTIVERQGTGTTYLSRKPVPAGVHICNRKYWIKFSKHSDIPYEITQEFGDNEELAISQKAITQKIDKIQDVINRLHPGNVGVKISVTPNIIYNNTINNVTIRAWMDDGNIADNIKIIVGDTIIEDQKVTEINTNIELNNEINIRVLAKQGSFTYESTANVIGVYPYYVGSSIDYTNIINSTYKQNIKNNPYGLYNIEVPENNYKIYFIIPVNMTINKATMSGFDFPLNNPILTEIQGINYKIYESSNTYDAGILTIIIS